MALQKQPININFAQGLDTKSDPYQLELGKFITLNNMVFDTAKRLTKRNGFDNITNLPNDDQTTLTTLNDNLLATGSSLYAFSATTDQWINQGTVQPVSLNVKSMVRNSTSQIAQDAAVADNGLVCVVYTDHGLAYYHIIDSNTGQQVIGRTALGADAGQARAFVLGRYFIITFTATVTATPHLRYISIPINMPGSPATAVDISTTISVLNVAYDGFVSNNNLYIAHDDAAPAINIVKLASTLILSAATVLPGETADLISVTADDSQTSPIIWVSWWDDNTDDGFSAAYDGNLQQVLIPTQVINNVIVDNLTSIAQDGVCTVIYETLNTYASTYPVANVKTDFISKVTIAQAGTVGSPAVVLRSVGLASKPFIGLNSAVYMWCTYGETNQPTYFLIDVSGSIYSRLAYQNGGGYSTTQVLPSISEINGDFYFPYLIKDFLTNINKGTSLPTGTPTTAVYTQTGVNLAIFSINTSGQYSSNIAQTLHLTGGQLWMYDGVKPVEHGFQVWPENVAAQGITTAGSLIEQKYNYVFTYEWTDNQGNLHRSAPSIPYTFEVFDAPVSFTGNRTSGSAVITSVSSLVNIQVGQAVSGTGIPASTYILSIDSATQITLTNNATSGTATSTVITPLSVSAVKLYVPTLRLTYKVSPNPVRIVGYRWSTAQQTYYQFTSVTDPNLNNPAVDFIEITDSNSDARILGQTLLYTTGGVVENIAAPGSVDTALFKNRLFLIDTENRNLLWYSKEVIQGVPVEMSDLFTIFVAPTTGAQGSTGEMTAISAMDDKFIIFKREAIYYITGSGPDNTGSNNTFSEPIFITASVGCNNPSSIALTPNGLMFQSDKGIWLLSRDLSTSYIGNPVEIYNTLQVSSVTVVPDTTRVEFDLPNDITLVYDYYYNQWATNNNIKAISSTIYQSKHTYLNQYGQVLQQTTDTYTDGSRPVLMSFTTSWINIAGLQGYERLYFLYLLGNYYTPFKLSVDIIYDYNPTIRQAVMVTPENYSPPWGGDALWGSGEQWGGPGNVFSARIFPDLQKCQAFQLVITEIYDGSHGSTSGKGLDLSGINLVIGVKKGYRVQKASQSFG